MRERPMAWIFFLLFILISTFVVLNLFLAVVVNAMDSVRDQEDADVQAKLPTATGGTGPNSHPAPVAGAAAIDPAAVAEELAALRHEVMALRRLLTAEAPDAPVPQPRS
jgi:voltage-gated sodium channel